MESGFIAVEIRLSSVEASKSTLDGPIPASSHSFLHKLVGAPQHRHDLVDAVRVVALLKVRPHLVAQGLEREQYSGGERGTSAAMLSNVI